MSTNVTLEQVEELAKRLPPTEQLKLVARISDDLSRSGVAIPSPGAEMSPQASEAIADRLLQELDAIADSIEGEFDAVEEVRQIRDERVKRL